jgi:hypothetical protein
MSMFGKITQTSTTLLNTVEIAGNSTARTISTAASVLDMADAFVQNAKQKQIINNHFEMETYVSTAKSNAWEAHANQVTQLENRLNMDANLKKNYLSLQDEYTRIETELKEKLAKA